MLNPILLLHIIFILCFEKINFTGYSYLHKAPKLTKYYKISPSSFSSFYNLILQRPKITSGPPKHPRIYGKVDSPLSKETSKCLIGIESHVQLNTKSKAFCKCSSSPILSTPNYNICPVCIGEPGTLPSINYEAIRLSLLAALALNCSIAESISFNRKIYHYQDLPKNYQITQETSPLGTNGNISLPSGISIPIQKVHLEEDSARSIKKIMGNFSDFNRAGIPLLEITTKTYPFNSYNLIEYLATLIQLLKSLDISNCKMEMGQFRCDINISVSLNSISKTHPRVELKNLSSLKAIREAFIYEVKRQLRNLDFHKNPLLNISESRYWDSYEKKTIKMRTKEKHEDYLYSNEIDIPTFEIPTYLTTSLSSETITNKILRISKTYSISLSQASFLCRHPKIIDYFEEAVATGAPVNETINWILNDIGILLLKYFEHDQTFTFTPRRLSYLLKLVKDGDLNHQTSKALFQLSLNDPKTSLENLIAIHNLSKITNKEEIVKAIKSVLEKFPKQAVLYRQGKRKLFRFFIAQIMNGLNYRADPILVNNLLNDTFNNFSP